MRQHQRVPPVRLPYLLSDVITSVAHAFQRAADERGIKLITTIPARRWEMFGDAKRVSLALGELVHNSLKHTRPGGLVQIRLAAKAKPLVSVSVTDDGEGVPRELSKDVFNPYFSFSRAGGRAGTGLGLSIASGIILEEGGRLTHSPGRPSGAVFTMVLPRRANR